MTDPVSPPTDAITECIEISNGLCQQCDDSQDPEVAKQQLQALLDALKTVTSADNAKGRQLVELFASNDALLATKDARIAELENKIVDIRRGYAKEFGD